MDRRAFLSATGLAFVAAPLAAEALAPGPTRTVGILGHTPAVTFEEGLHDLGWVVGKNIRFERRVSADDETLARFAAELNRIPVDVIFAGNAPSTRAAMQATRVIPIVTVSADPVSTGSLPPSPIPEGTSPGSRSCTRS